MCKVVDGMKPKLKERKEVMDLELQRWGGASRNEQRRWGASDATTALFENTAFWSPSNYDQLSTCELARVASPRDDGK